MSFPVGCAPKCLDLPFSFFEEDSGIGEAVTTGGIESGSGQAAMLVAVYRFCRSLPYEGFQSQEKVE